MGWLDRLFPGNKPAAAQTGIAGTTAAPAATPTSAGQSIPPERVGLDGNYDESGLAKRVALAYDNDAQLDDVGTLWVAQLGSKVVLRGKVPDQSYLSKAAAIARGVNGATDVDTSEVTVG